MMTRLLITGAAGSLGGYAREGLKDCAQILRLSDVAELSPAGKGEEVVRCDLAEREAVDELVRDCDAILHLGAISAEAEFDALLQANILGTYNLYEAARRAGVSRILFASTNHVTGFHPVGERLDHLSPRRPDSLYGVSKCFGEDLSRLYFDKYGLETACLRIGSCFAEPTNRRMLSTWLSPDDFRTLIRQLLAASEIGHLVLYGVSANRDVWWSNAHADFLGWRPQDSSEAYRPATEAREEEPAKGVRYQGGRHAALKLSD
ncbi:NAD-dependent epimerase/dehydratase family protein [Sinorhizobium medicae]|uniref:NAD-dependent dehydratase n=1 Tax=Sinorhizobium medicae TaxID=110321 RepID=A0ABX4TNL9_9HYPH|nr:NAD(P)-dependent oxidoreductase [Sinorhizobium medicae]PLU04255.1 NAD-dependent dehydratase [Sinorhizobium medicae]PLU19878.1 NAD-dependent dehydratase [Sinorhizobium medicae]PLU22238.1 NAD-dependent dehydratase [Sinorhizobium medicae]PLU30245.1 NAD-dependent dehydratase [Sinorhizobium medicae]PLU80589.1 NAD-dependent dehydratase [Sinorhizobium medicae]